jgi:DHA2 family multidrug resistance protein
MVVSRLIGRVDSRYLIAFGFTILCVSTYMFTGINLYIAQTNIIYPMIFSGFAMGFVFVPLTTISMATLPVEQIGNASGIYNLMRNTGGSFGIAIMTTLLNRNQQIHLNVLSAHMTEYDPAFQASFQQIRSGLLATMDPVSATQQAYQVISGMAQQQAAVLAYIDDFWLMTIICFLCIPAGFFFIKVRNARPVEGAH